MKKQARIQHAHLSATRSRRTRRRSRLSLQSLKRMIVPAFCIAVFFGLVAIAIVVRNSGEMPSGGAGPATNGPARPDSAGGDCQYAAGAVSSECLYGAQFLARTGGQRLGAGLCRSQAQRGWYSWSRRYCALHRDRQPVGRIRYASSGYFSGPWGMPGSDDYGNSWKLDDSASSIGAHINL